MDFPCAFFIHLTRCVLSQMTAPVHIDPTPPNRNIHYPHIRVPVSQFSIRKGTEKLTQYYRRRQLSAQATKQSPSAHVFCSTCGVEIIHASSAVSRELIVNVFCLDESNKRQDASPSVRENGSVPAYTEGACSNIASGQRSLNGEGYRMMVEERSYPSHFENGSVPTDTEGGCGNQASGQRVLNGDWCRMMVEERENNCGTPVPADSLGSKFTPGTPSTSSSTEASVMDTARSAIEDDFLAFPGISVDTEPFNRSRLISPVHTTYPIRMSSTDSPHEPPTTTPLVRDQIKFYMRKHI